MGPLAFVVVVVLVAASIPVTLAVARRLVMGHNGYSLSKLQIVLWTTAIAVSYLLCLWKLQRDPDASLAIAIPSNLLLLMGFSGGSYLAAYGVRAYQEQRYRGEEQKRVRTARLESHHANWTDIVSDYAGGLDISKVQMLVWTVVALSAYVIQFAHDYPQLGTMLPALPDVGDALVALMGVSQAAYIGRKAIPERKPDEDGSS